jgi:PhzF family phenazine biosynthesis protein
VDDQLAEHVAEILRISRDEIVDLQWADNGPGWIAVLLASADAVLAVRPGPTDLDLGIAGPYPAGGPAAFEVRAFLPKNGTTDEDPVTGSFNASLAQWLLATGRATAPYVARQGTALGRTGEVRITTDGDGQVWVGGSTVTCVFGTVEL